MKKLYIALSHFAIVTVFALTLANSEAQNAIPNPGFENWTNQGSYDDPDGWGTLNSQTSALGIKTVLKSTSVHSGSFAINLVTKHITFINQTAPGIAGSNGVFDQNCSCFIGGVPYNLRPDSITGWFKYSPVSTDTASVEITLSKWNGTSRDVVGSVKFTQSTAVTTYTQFKTKINYSLTTDPDTMVIILLASWTGATSSNNNSSFFVDDLALTFPSTPLSATATFSNATCNATCNGTATVSASGGTSPFTYLWSNGQTNATATGLCAGTFTVTVTDGSSQTVTSSVVISQPAAITATILSTMPPLCNGQANGSVNLSASGGTGTLTFSWSNSFTTEDLTGVGAGTYTVTVTDANGCTKTATATVSQPTAISLSISSTDETSSGANDGTATVSASGGTSGYTYLWSNNATTASISGLAPNTYSVTVTDANQCTVTGSASVNGAGCALTATTTSQNATCGQSNGSATVTAIGNPQTHTVTVANFSFTPNSVNAAVGDTIHWVWSAGSHTTTSGTIPSGASSWNSPMNSTSNSFKYVVTQVGTYNYVCTPHAPNMAGVINVTGAFTYVWSNGQASAIATGLSAGNYSVTVTDASSCNVIANVTVGNVPGPTATVTTTPDTAGQSNGTATVFASGASSPYTYLWSNNQSTMVATGLAAGTYTVTVTDANNCSNSITATVLSAAGINVLANSGLFFSVYPNPSSDGKFRIWASQSVIQETVKIYNMIGKEIYKKELEGNLPVIIDLSNEAAGIYYFNISSSDKILTKKIAFTKGY